MNLLKYVTGLFAILMITVFPVAVRSDDICEESLTRAEACVASFVDGTVASGAISDERLEKLIRGLACEPDIYDVEITVGIRHIVPGGGSYYVDINDSQVRSMLGRGETILLSEGDTVTVRAEIVSPSVFSRLSGRYEGTLKRHAAGISMGRRMGRM